MNNQTWAERKLAEYAVFAKKSTAQIGAIGITESTQFWHTALNQLWLELEKLRPGTCDCTGAKYECEHWGSHETLDAAIALVSTKHTK